ncbi:MAG: ATP-dependent DNA helicase RecG [Lachnospiraceae bacterium]|nr:ATP-dependent DNA helicase RecG [Lachnospiraceae bacterium]
MELSAPIRTIKGIGEKTESAFRKAGVLTVRDLLYYYPRAYESHEPPVPVSALRFRDEAASECRIVSRPVTRYVKRMQITEALLQDESGTVKAVWYNMPYLSKSLHAGNVYVFSGKLDGSGIVRRFKQPKIYRPEEYRELTKTLSPVYPLNRDLSETAIRKALKTVFDAGVLPEETLSEKLLKAYDLLPIEAAIKEIHFPTSREAFLFARKRLVFEEFYRFLIKIKELKQNVEKVPNSFVFQPKEEIGEVIGALPFSLTGAQLKVLGELRSDTEGPSVMNRLVQGDVGSGKTILAFLLMLEASLNGYQSALMAPTEVLARQHHENFRQWSDEFGLNLTVTLLTGSMTAKEKRLAAEKIALHQTDIIVGTHALIQENVHYSDLALVVTDEQHRFGVNQRKALSEKGRMPHVLVMSATPIPRTLGMILYGDMNISVIDELPKNRLPIKNALVDIEYRGKAYAFIRKEVEKGHQAYVICPKVSETEGQEGESVEEYSKMLRAALPESIQIGTLHGRMKAEKKDEIMTAFAQNKIQVLVSTTVVEVGIDVPNATVMMIENAERFGLASLHQLRGRVGRGKDQSYCILVDTTKSDESRERLEVVSKSNDGFFIASEDLRLRGPGDFFGIRQSGEMAFRLADIYADAAVLQCAEEAAEKTVKREDGLTPPVL